MPPLRDHRLKGLQNLHASVRIRSPPPKLPIALAKIASLTQGWQRRISPHLRPAFPDSLGTSDLPNKGWTWLRGDISRDSSIVIVNSYLTAGGSLWQRYQASCFSNLYRVVSKR